MNQTYYTSAQIWEGARKSLAEALRVRAGLTQSQITELINKITGMKEVEEDIEDIDGIV